MKNKYNISIIFLTFIFVQSCETITSLPGKIYDGGVDTIDYVGSIFTDEDSEVEQSKSNDKDKEIIGAKPEGEIIAKIDENLELKNEKDLIETANIRESDQVLEPVPAEELEVTGIVNNQTETSYSDNLNDESSESRSEESLRSEKSFKKNNIDFKSLKTNLNLENKIQFRIATINFSSGSSSLNNKDIKKIRKVMKLAKEKNARVRIVGHASTRTKDMEPIKHKLANFNISDKRSQAVAKIFIDNNFPLKNLITEAVSDSKPLFYESMPAGTYGNQRTEIYLIY